MSKYEKDLQLLRPEDEMQGEEKDKATGYPFITTASHGFLVVPVEDKEYPKAVAIGQGYRSSNLAIYLEEDCEYFDFLKAIQ